jgi:multidrug resistance efflux pump
MSQNDKPKVLSAEEQAEADALRKTIKDTEAQIALAKSGSSSREFREDLGILLREAQARLDEIIPPSAAPPTS